MKLDKTVSFSALCMVKENPSNMFIVCWSNTKGKPFVVDWGLLTAGKENRPAEAAACGEMPCPT